jgi:RNA polymerase sigma factor (sigma-70 family)
MMHHHSTGSGASGVALLDARPDEDTRADDEAHEREKQESVTTDLVRHYLNDAGRHPLLDREQEADLAKRYQAGLAAEQILHAGRLRPRTRARLEAIRRDGRRAQHTMVQANLRLVVSQARRLNGHRLELLELIQEGNLGLLRAVEKFDHTRGYKFSTYAVWWIAQALQRGVAAKARTIRVPAHVWEQYANLRAIETRLRQEFGGEPTEEEIADEIGLSLEAVRDLRRVMQDLTSLDRPIGEDGDSTLGDTVPDPDAIDPAGTALAADDAARVEAAMATLEEREQLILVLRFGLRGEEPQTFEEIGERMGLSRERIRQMQNRALAKLRRAPQVRRVDDSTPRQRVA